MAAPIPNRARSPHVHPNRASSLRARPTRAAFSLALLACAAFVVLTALAMLFYPGGTALDDKSVGYHFWFNFFSDLGRTRARNGAANPVAAPMFKAALSAAGAALAIFHLGLARVLWASAPRRALPADCALMALGASGALAGACFVGVALSPANLQPHFHAVYVVWAFRFFLLSSILSGAIVRKRPAFPRALVWLVGAFALLLFAYLLLIWRGPSPATELGLAVQATSQKIIVYAAVLCVAAQSWVMRKFE